MNNNKLKIILKKEKSENSANVPNVSINGYCFKGYINKEYKLDYLQSRRLVVYCFKENSQYLKDISTSFCRVTKNVKNNKNKLFTYINLLRFLKQMKNI